MAAEAMKNIQIDGQISETNYTCAKGSDWTEINSAADISPLQSPTKPGDARGKLMDYNSTIEPRDIMLSIDNSDGGIGNFRRNFQQQIKINTHCSNAQVKIFEKDKSLCRGEKTYQRISEEIHQENISEYMTELSTNPFIREEDEEVDDYCVDEVTCGLPVTPETVETYRLPVTPDTVETIKSVDMCEQCGRVKLDTLKTLRLRQTRGTQQRAEGQVPEQVLQQVGREVPQQVGAEVPQQVGGEVPQQVGGEVPQQVGEEVPQYHSEDVVEECQCSESPEVEDQQDGSQDPSDPELSTYDNIDMVMELSHDLYSTPHHVSAENLHRPISPPPTHVSADNLHQPSDSSPDDRGWETRSAADVRPPRKRSYWRKLSVPLVAVRELFASKKKAESPGTGSSTGALYQLDAKGQFKSI